MRGRRDSGAPARDHVGVSTPLWVLAAVAVLAALFAVDLSTAASIPPSLFAATVLIVAVRGGERPTAAVAVLATTLAVIVVSLREGPVDGMDVVRLLTAAAIGAL